jgi:hypothetical protein
MGNVFQAIMSGPSASHDLKRYAKPDAMLSLAPFCVQSQISISEILDHRFRLEQHHHVQWQKLFHPE